MECYDFYTFYRVYSVKCPLRILWILKNLSHSPPKAKVNSLNISFWPLFCAYRLATKVFLYPLWNSGDLGRSNMQTPSKDCIFIFLWQKKKFPKIHTQQWISTDIHETHAQTAWKYWTFKVLEDVSKKLPVSLNMQIVINFTITKDNLGTC